MAAFDYKIIKKKVDKIIMSLPYFGEKKKVFCLKFSWSMWEVTDEFLK